MAADIVFTQAPSIVKAGKVFDITGVLKDSDGTAIDVANIGTFTITLFAKATPGTKINNRDGQNAKNDNNVTLDASGNLHWYGQPEDSVYQAATGNRETHVVQFEWTFTNAGGSRVALAEIEYLVEKPLDEQS